MLNFSSLKTTVSSFSKLWYTYAWLQYKGSLCFFLTWMFIYNTNIYMIEQYVFVTLVMGECCISTNQKKICILTNQKCQVNEESIWVILSQFNPLSANPTKWSNTLQQFVGNSGRIVWVCLPILWSWRLKGLHALISHSVVILTLLNPENWTKLDNFGHINDWVYMKNIFLKM